MYFYNDLQKNDRRMVVFGMIRILHDTITVTLDPECRVLVVKNYSGSEYPAYKGFINCGDIHGCEPWLYSECLKQNIALRIREWKKKNSE